MECYRVQLPPGARLTGLTAAGQRVSILPGDYHVHRLRPKFPLRGGTEALRFVAALGPSADIHVPLPGGRDIRSALPPEARITADA